LFVCVLVCLCVCLFVCLFVGVCVCVCGVGVDGSGSTINRGKRPEKKGSNKAHPPKRSNPLSNPPLLSLPPITQPHHTHSPPLTVTSTHPRTQSRKEYHMHKHQFHSSIPSIPQPPPSHPLIPTHPVPQVRVSPPQTQHPLHTPQTLPAITPSIHSIPLPSGGCCYVSPPTHPVPQVGVAEAECLVLRKRRQVDRQHPHPLVASSSASSCCCCCCGWCCCCC
jgi:hypothetical protein